jgi:PAS domain-containing protein
VHVEEAAQSQQLLQIERHWKDVLDAMFAFVALMEPDGTITWMNRAARSVAGPVDAVGTNFTELYSFGHSPRLREQLAESVRRAAAGEVVKGELENRPSDDAAMASPSPSRPASTPAAGSSS